MISAVPLNVNEVWPVPPVDLTVTARPTWVLEGKTRQTQAFRAMKGVTTLWLDYLPATGCVVSLWRNGILQRVTDHYTITDNVISLLASSSAEGEDFDVLYLRATDAPLLVEP